MFKQITLPALELIKNNAHRFNKWLFRTKQTYEDRLILADILNSEIYLQKYGLENFYQLLECQPQLIRYVRIKEEYNLNSKFLVYERDMLLPDEFEYYMLKLAKNLKESLFFRELSHVQLDSVTQETVFSYDLETAFKFIEKKGDRLNIIFIDDNVAYVCVT
ncbi:hypothetical protein NYR70_10305 [Actinobacillus equuli subsp. equuli]|uniref:hypothetical protein n=1 Tax=Actinobacillus equuli TaxID=718 RepID=UPI0024186EFC|nr:hypothetical protein [Actinobacillus equuli]MDG4953507.1 hypothetical protein [Actinobacillus equuli subsp. equuli]WGE48627.1 hypothetical protein NYR67_10230 [Actinobacillus equuli subsp. equuli]WGE55007.1 hypothetical protein NYR70_10305 [Actinobacillus equuli subsp. equuli]WGE57082.1 hypothetical protein NYR71_10280 [Actinobacillus equuli subsp. equuli]WGE79263.1 hypothetical protein NYR83_10300 [Actinobacillus equuli subsp. equuli]